MKTNNNSNLFLPVLVFIILLILSSCGTKKRTTAAKKIEAVTFLMNDDNTLTNVLDKAAAENKLVFLDFYADWCLPCQLMDEEVFNKAEVYNFMNKHFVSYKVDIEKSNGANLKLIFAAEKLPTLLFLDASGKELDRREETIFQTELMSIVKGLVH